MRIFKANNQKNKSSDRFAGFHIDPHSDALVSLWALSQGVSRASLLRQFVKDKLSDINPVNLVARRAFRIYPSAKMSEQSFIHNLKDDLRAKSIPEDLIDEVIVRFKEMRNKARNGEEKN